MGTLSQLSVGLQGVVRASADDFRGHRFEAGHLKRQAGDQVPVEGPQGNVSVPEMTALRGPDPGALAHLLRVPRPTSFLGAHASHAGCGARRDPLHGRAPLWLQQQQKRTVKNQL